MKKIHLIPKIAISTGVIAGVLSMPVATTYAVTSTNTGLTAAQTVRLTAIKTKGDQEIDRRIARLTTLNAKISNASKLTASDKTTLTSEVAAEINDLTALKVKLDAETTPAAAGADAKSIIDDYRVYALIVPKVALVRVADDQQVVESRLVTAVNKLQTHVTAAKTAGKEVSDLQSKLDDAMAKIQASTATSSGIQSKVIALQPSDYNNDHTIVQGDYAQLMTARSSNKAALDELKSVRDSLKQLAAQ